MEKFWHIVEHAFLDSIKVLPILLLVYILIELIEYKHARKFENLKFLNRRSSSVFGALFGSLPQCGFSVVATDLYSKRKVNIGTLIAVYIATSDEAIPIMLSSVKSLKALIPLIVAKIVIAILIGFIAQVLFERFFVKKSENKLLLTSSKTIDKKVHSLNESVEINHDHDHHKDNHDEHDHDKHDEDGEKLELHKGCCNHGIEDAKFNWHHPLFHSLKIFVTILIINIIFGIIIEFGFKGEEKLAEFLTQNSIFWLQPLLAMLIGFIPNCASSVVLTELYLLDGLTFGALLAGLIVNAGLGLILLFKQNKNLKENSFIVITLIVTSLVFGYLIHFIV